MDAKILHELLKYSDGKLYWKIQISNRIKAGDVAGCLGSHCYYHLQVNGKLWLAHRLIFMMHYGYFPKFIDHIDGNTKNNRIENLRDASLSQNGYNRKLQKNNTSGAKGVSWHKKSNKWQVKIRIDGAAKHIGLYDDLEFAELVAQEARNKYHGSYANHG